MNTREDRTGSIHSITFTESSSSLHPPFLVNKLRPYILCANKKFLKLREIDKNTIFIFIATYIDARATGPPHTTPPPSSDEGCTWNIFEIINNWNHIHVAASSSVPGILLSLRHNGMYGNLIHCCCCSSFLFSGVDVVPLVVGSFKIGRRMVFLGCYAACRMNMKC